MAVSAQTIRRWVEEGALEAEYVGLRRLVRISEDELRRLAQEKSIYFTPKPE